MHNILGTSTVVWAVSSARVRFSSADGSNFWPSDGATAALRQVLCPNRWVHGCCSLLEAGDGDDGGGPMLGLVSSELAGKNSSSSLLSAVKNV